MLINDPLCYFDKRVKPKEVNIYDPLKFQLAGLGKLKNVTIIPVTIVGLGTVTKTT